MKLELDNLLQSAKQATTYALLRAGEAESVWHNSLTWLRSHQEWSDREHVLKILLHSFETEQQLARSARELWEVSEQHEITTQQIIELDQAEKLFGDLVKEIARILERKAIEWEPTDAARFQRGLQAAREGKTVKADEARIWFHPLLNGASFAV